MEAGKSFLSDWGALVICGMVQFVLVFDSLMIANGITAITSEFGDPNLVGSAMIMAALINATLQIAGGKLGSIYGIKRIMLIGLSILLISLVIAGISTSAGMFLGAWSILKSIGYILTLPLTGALLVAKYKGSKRALSFGVFAATAGLGAALGPLAMGVFATQLNWRIIFIPEFALLLVATLVLRRVSETPKVEASIDWVGVMLLVIAFGGLVYGFSSTNVIALLLGSLGLGVFVYWSNRLEKTSREPIFRVRIFQNRSFSTSILVQFLFIMAANGFTFFVPTVLQREFGVDALTTGLLLLPFTLASGIVALASGSLGERFDKRQLMILAVILYGIGISTIFLFADELLIIILLLVVMGTGAGIVLPFIQNIALSAIPESESGEASGMFYTVTDLAVAITIALLGMLVASEHIYFFGLAILIVIAVFLVPKTKKE